MGNFCDVMDDKNMPDDYHAHAKKRGHRRIDSRGSGFYLIEMQKPQNQYNEDSDSDFSSTYSMEEGLVTAT